MANANRHANLRPPIQKGEVRNPYGRLGKDPVLAALRSFGKKEFTRILDLVLTSTITDLKTVIKDPETSALTAGVAMALLKATRTGDWRTLEGIVERIVGKVPVKMDHTSGGDKIGASERVVLYLPANGRTKEETDELAAADGAGF